MSSVSATLQASGAASGADETPVEAHLRRILDTQPVSLTHVNVDGIFLAVNDAALSMLGAEHLEQVLGTSLLDMVAPASRESCRVFLSRVAAGDRGSTEVEFTGLGGLAHTLHLHATTHPGSPDGTSSVLVTLRDITEYRHLEHAVIEAAAREEQRAAALAANEEEKRSLAAEHERARAEWEREHQQAQAQWDRERQQLQALTARIASVETERDGLNSELVMVGPERLAWSARLDHAERLARAGRLSLSFADDIDTALRGIAAYGRLLMGDAGQGLQRDNLNQMLAAATAAQALVRQLRHGARTVELAPMEISPVIHSLERTLAGLLSPDITLCILPGAEGARVGLTSQQVEQVALTLAANRRAAMAKGGQVTIELAEVDIDEDCARERMASPGPYVLMAVHAAGPEVERGIAPQLFGTPANEDTWQTAGPGMSGLFAMVNEWGGCLWASQEGPDALAFEIYIPRVMAGRDASPGARR